MKKLYQLFITTFVISAFTFGGGYVIVPLFRKKFVDQLRWIKDDEMMDLIAIAQATPGAIAINASIAIGYRLFRLKGALTAVIATFLPPMCIIMLIYSVYDTFKSNEFIIWLLQGMQVGVCAVVVDVVLDLILGVYRERQRLSWVLLGASICLTLVFNSHLMVVLFGLTLLGLLYRWIER